MADTHEDWYREVKQPGSERRAGSLLYRSWFWITLVFFGQGICSVLFAKIVHIPPGEVLLPITVLFLGGVSGLLFLSLNDPGKGLKWQGVVPALVYGSFIYLMSGRGFTGVRPGFDVGYFHLVEFATLGLFLGNIWYSVIKKKGFARFAVRVIAVGGVFGVADEIHQAFVPGRTADVVDLAFDITGLLISLLIIASVRRLVMTRPANSRQDPE